MDCKKLGVLEIFFGPPWREAERRSWATFLGEQGLGFYLYGPKADARLRKNWREPWPPEYLAAIRSLAGLFHSQGVRFAVALSPFGMRFPAEQEALEALRAKCSQLRQAGIDFLGLFFDDMACTEQLADLQLDLLSAVRNSLELPVVFCPSYYSPDAVLDKVFGARPADYLERIGREIPAGVEILWTGPKVISPEIPPGHLRETAAVLRRPPFLCDNFFANDGPRQCKFLKLKPVAGRTPEALGESSHWSLNLMNQSALSQLMAYSAKLVFTGACGAEAALERSFRERLSPECAQALLRDRVEFLTAGLDQIGEDRKKELCREYEAYRDAAAKEVVAWLEGKYAVGEECLTD